MRIPTGSVFDAMEVALDLSGESRDLYGTYTRLGKEGGGAFLDMLANVLQRGIVGTETLEVDGQARTTFITTRLGDPRLMHARAYRDSVAFEPRIDLTA